MMTPIPDWLKGRHTGGRSDNGVLHIYAEGDMGPLSVPLDQYWHLFSEQLKRDVVSASLVTGANQPVHLSKYVTLHSDGQIVIFGGVSDGDDT